MEGIVQATSASDTAFPVPTGQRHLWTKKDIQSLLESHMTDQQWQQLQLSTETMCTAENIIVWRELPGSANQPEVEYETFNVADYVEARTTVEDSFRQQYPRYSTYAEFFFQDYFPTHENQAEGS